MNGRSALLQKTVEQAERLTEGEQDALAHVMQEAMTADAAWSKVLSHPKSEELLEQLANEARQEIKAGQAIELDPSDRSS